jgi:MscS family membrane protein
VKPVQQFALFTWITLFAGQGLAASENPLSPANTSSPRDTLHGFILTMEERFLPAFGPDGLLHRYMASGHVFISEQDILASRARVSRASDRSLKYMDLAELPIATRDQSAWRVAVQLKEILDRVDLPSLDQIPGDNEVASGALKRWVIPGTEIEIVRVEDASKGDRYLFSRETVRQIPHYYALVKDMPYTFTRTAGMHDFIFEKPTGLAIFLHRIVPARWILETPQWAYVRVLKEPLWKWGAMSFLFSGIGFMFWLSILFSRHEDPKPNLIHEAKRILPPLTLLATIPILEFILGEILRVSPELFSSISLLFWALFYIAMPWLIWIVGGFVSVWLIQSEHINTNHVDAQLIRLGARLVAMVIGTATLVEGANRLGLPAYSVIAGLGIGGLAIALAGQQALANLLGSLIIMIEKPFRVGQAIKTSGFEGMVEDIGFRSTRVRTLDNTLMTVPSALLLNSAIENLSQRKAWHIQKTIFLNLDTPISKVKAFKEQVEQLMIANPLILSDKVQVSINQLSIDCYELLVDFTVKGKNVAEKTKVTQDVICEIAALSERERIGLGRSLEAGKTD